jgi:hypothetical protein
MKEFHKLPGYGIFFATLDVVHVGLIYNHVTTSSSSWLLETIEEKVLKVS